MKANVHVFFGVVMAGHAFAQNTEALRPEIEREFRAVRGTFAVALKELSSGITLLINEKENFHAASTMKTPVMIEVFRQAKQGRFSLDDSVMVKNEFKSIVDSSPYKLDLADDSDDSMYRKIGTKATIHELVRQMITVSSNLATNILIELVSAANVTASMRSLGATDIQVLRGVEDMKAFDRGMNNTTTAYDLMVIYESLAMGTAVDRKASDEMVKILLDQKFHEKIPALLPMGARVAHKTGNITGVEHDSGVVFLPDGRTYVLVFLSKDLKDAKAAQAAMARVSHKIYDFLMTND